MDALHEAISCLVAYQYRINQDTFRGDPESRTRYENAAYQEGMLSAAIAQAHAQERMAEQLKRIADALYSGEGSPLSLALADLVKLIHAQVAENGPA